MNNDHKDWRKMLTDLGGWDNECIMVPAGAVRQIIEEVEALRLIVDAGATSVDRNAVLVANMNNIAAQCRATASHPISAQIEVDGGSGLLRELLLDAAGVIECALAAAPASPAAPTMPTDANCSPVQFLHNVCADVLPALRNCNRNQLAFLLELALKDLPLAAPVAQPLAPSGAVETWRERRDHDRARLRHSNMDDRGLPVQMYMEREITDLRAALAAQPLAPSGVVPYPAPVQIAGEPDESFFRRTVYVNGWNECLAACLKSAATVAQPLAGQVFTPQQKDNGADAERAFTSWHNERKAQGLPGLADRDGFIAGYLYRAAAPVGNNVAAAIPTWQERIEGKTFAAFPGKQSAMQAEINDLRAALAAGAPAETPPLVIALPDYETRQIEIASDEMIDGKRVVCVAIQGAPAETAKAVGSAREQVFGYVNDQVKREIKAGLVFDAAPQIDATTAPASQAASSEAVAWRYRLRNKDGFAPDQWNVTTDPTWVKRMGRAWQIEPLYLATNAAAPATAPDVVKDAARYRAMFGIENFCAEPLWPVVDWMRGGPREPAKEEVDAALDAYIAAMGALPPPGSEKGGA